MTELIKTIWWRGCVKSREMDDKEMNDDSGFWFLDCKKNERCCSILLLQCTCILNIHVGLPGYFTNFCWPFPPLPPLHCCIALPNKHSLCVALDCTL